MSTPSHDATAGRDGPQTRKRSWFGLFILAVLAFTVLIALGTWQIQRKAWKENLIASLTERLAAPAKELPPAADWPKLDRARDEYSRVKFEARFDNSREAFVFAAPSTFRPDAVGPGYWVFTPARLDEGSTVMVNRGFVPDGRQDPKSRSDGQVVGPVEITGAMRWPGDRHWFTPNDDPAHNLWFTPDPGSIAKAKGLDSRANLVAPFYVEQEAPVPPGGLPQPGRLEVTLPDNHLQYALTWYGLAAVLAGVFGFWTFSAQRQ